MDGKSLDDLRRLWEEIDDAIALMPDSLLVEALGSPYLSELDKVRIKTRLGGKNGHKTELAA